MKRVGQMELQPSQTGITRNAIRVGDLKNNYNMETKKQFGDLILTFTSKFHLRYNDEGSGATKNGAFWHPQAPGGFYALGSVGSSNYNDINENSWALCVAAAPGKADAIAHPVSYTGLWNDKGSGARLNGSCWRPVPPPGYVALGDVFSSTWGPPALTDIVCVRADLTAKGQHGVEIYNDTNSGGDAFIVVYEAIVPGNSTYSEEKALFSANTLIANTGHFPPADIFYCLQLPLPVEKLPAASLPPLTKVTTPDALVGETVDRVVHVPFTAVTDKSYSDGWKVANSPFYKIKRKVAYHLEVFEYNETDTAQVKSKSVTTGVKTTQSSTFSVNTGISVTAEGGVSVLGTGGKMSATVSVALGYDRTTTFEVFKEVTITCPLTTLPHTAGAAWAINHCLVVEREDKTELLHKLSFDTASFILQQYNPSTNDTVAFIQKQYTPVADYVTA